MNDRLTPMVNGYPPEDDPDFDTETGVPLDVLAFMELHDIKDKYRCLLKWYNSASNSYEVITRFENSCPDIVDVGKKYGPGKYSLFFSYMGADVGERKKSKVKELKFNISEHMRGEHEKYVEEQTEIRQREKKAKLAVKKEEAIISNLENGGIAPVGQTATEMAKEQIELAKALAGIGNKGPDTMSILLPLLMEQSKNQMNMMMSFMQMMMQNQNRGPQGGGMGEIMGMAKGFMNMTTELLSFKKEIDAPPEEKESFGEKIFNQIAGHLPAIIEYATQSAVARAANPMAGMMVNAAKNSEQFQKIKNDEQSLTDFIRRSDAKFAPESTDKVLALMGCTRPAAARPPAPSTEEPGEE